ncbi:MAG TPA: DUF4936 family protein [Methylibium sp.]|jgi:hypothetical protein|nr:DUF4936 family protein [Methylibium sp.]
MPHAHPTGHELFVYYRAWPQDAQRLADAVLEMQRQLCIACPGLRARLLGRPELRDGMNTWMETYALPEGFEPEPVGAAIERAAKVLGDWIVGPRRVEHFVACVS